MPAVSAHRETSGGVKYCGAPIERNPVLDARTYGFWSTKIESRKRPNLPENLKVKLRQRRALVGVSESGLTHTGELIIETLISRQGGLFWHSKRHLVCPGSTILIL